MVIHQRKIIANLERRKDTLANDNNKIYNDFNKVVDGDYQRQLEVSKQSMITLSKKDQSIINC